MHLKLNTPKQAINIADLRAEVNRVDIELLKTNFTGFLLSEINDKADKNISNNYVVSDKDLLLKLGATINEYCTYRK